MDAPDLAAADPPLPVPGQGFLGRAAWSFVGQAVSSGSNFLLSLLVLAVAPAAEFATFSLCLLTYASVLQLVRAAVAVPATLVQTGEADADAAQQQAAVGVSVAAAAVAGAGLLAVSPLAGHGRELLVVLGLALPLLVYQDALRYVCYARGRPSAAAGSDLAWLALQVVATLALVAAGRDSATTLLAAWAGAGAASGVATGIVLRLPAAFGAAPTWVRAHRVLWRRLLGEFVVASSSHAAVWYGLALVAGGGEFGRVKAAQTLLGPVVVVILGGAALSVPESVRVARDTERLRLVAVRLSAFLAATAVVCGVAAYALLPSVGPELFPKAWEGARPLIPALALFTTAMAAATGATAALRALHQNLWLLWVRRLTSAVVVPAGVVASAAFGAAGALVALASVETAYTVAAWRRFGTAIGAGASISVPER